MTGLGDSVTQLAVNVFNLFNIDHGIFIYRFWN